MKSFTYSALIVLTFACGWWGSMRWQQHASVNSADAAGKVLLYQSPMHPWVKSDKPGQCTVCGMDLVPIYEGGKNFDHVAGNIVMLPSGSPQVVGVQTNEVKRSKLVRSLRVAGSIGEDESRHGIISAPVEGRIDGLAMSCEGDKITRRQPLATIFSRTLLAAANDYKLALDHPGPTLDQTKQRLEQYGLVWEQIQTIPTRQPEDPYFGILATLTGTIVKSYVSEGQYVKEGEKLFEIADFNKMWFVFPAYEQDLPLIELGQVVTLRMKPPIKARVSFINPMLDETTRSAKVRVVIENPERPIKNNTFAEGIVEIETPEMLTVPRSAVLCPGAAPRVYVEKESGVYAPRSVKLGRSGDDAWEVLDGLKEGERVVVSGNMLIDGQSQLNKAAAP
jgi:membrane fusion protein, copper/silver efflux system